jgi:hypothetical protein
MIEKLRAESVSGSNTYRLQGDEGVQGESYWVIFFTIGFVTALLAYILQRPLLGLSTVFGISVCGVALGISSLVHSLSIFAFWKILLETVVSAQLGFFSACLLTYNPDLSEKGAGKKINCDSEDKR